MVDVLVTDEELVEQIQQGINVQQNMEILYKQTYKYIKKIVYPYSKVLQNSIFDIDDLMQEVYLNFHDAVQKYDHNQGIKFISFVVPFIKLGAKRFIESKLNLLHIPTDKANLAWRYNLLKKEYGSKPDSFFAEQLNISIYRLSKVKKIAELSGTLSFDYESSDEDDEKSLHDTYASDSDVENEVIQEMVQEQLDNVWKVAAKICTDTELHVIEGHYKEGKSFQELGQELGKCTEIARRHNVKALEKMRLDEEMINIAEMYFDYTPRCAFHYGVGRFKNTMTSSTEFLAIKHLEKEPNQYKYWLSEEGLSKIQKWIDQGLQKQQIASRMGISRMTLQRWTKKYIELSVIFEGKAGEQ